jgi:hypothetical protein
MDVRPSVRMISGKEMVELGMMQVFNSLKKELLLSNPINDSDINMI